MRETILAALASAYLAVVPVYASGNIPRPLMVLPLNATIMSDLSREVGPGHPHGQRIADISTIIDFITTSPQKIVHMDENGRFTSYTYVVTGHNRKSGARHDIVYSYYQKKGTSELQTKVVVVKKGSLPAMRIFVDRDADGILDETNRSVAQAILEGRVK
jgi:hypothetical protein